MTRPAHDGLRVGDAGALSSDGPLLADGAPRRSPVDRLAPLAFGSLGFLVLFLTRSAEQLRDSLVYADAVQRAEGLFHPHHLVFAFVIRMVYVLADSIGLAVSAVTAAQLHNALWSAVTLACFVAILQEIKVVTWMSLLAALGLLFSRGFWELSTQSTVYAAALGSIALVTWRLAAHRGREMDNRSLALIGVLWAVSCLYHQLNVLFGIPILVCFLHRFGTRSIPAWLLLASTAGTLTLAGYAVIYARTASEFSLRGFATYCLAYTEGVCWGENCVPSPDNWGSLVNLAPAGLAQASKSLVWNAVVLPPRAETIAAPLFGVVFLALIVWAFRTSRKASPFRSLPLLCGASMLTYGVFSTWWLPDYQHPFVMPFAFMMLLLPAMLAPLLEGGLLRRRTRWGLVAASFTIALLGGRNLQARIFPLQDGRGDSYEEARVIADLAGDKCEAVTSYRVWSNLRYYFDLGNRARLVKANLLSFYRGSAASMSRPSPSCRVIAARFLSPDFQITGYGATPLDGHQRPREWASFIGSVVSAQYDLQGRAVSSQDLRIVEAGDHVYVVVGGDDRAVSSLTEVLLDVESRLRANSPKIAQEMMDVIPLVADGHLVGKGNDPGSGIRASNFGR